MRCVCCLCLAAALCLARLLHSVTSDVITLPLTSTEDRTLGPPDTILHAGGAIRCDRYCCNCNGDKARCTGEGRHLHYLPRLPGNIRDFRLMRAELGVLTRPMMANLSNVALRVVNLTYCHIRHVQREALSDFVHLQVLDLSGNPVPVPDLQASLAAIPSRQMHTVSLADTGITALPDHFFATFYNASFKKVDLRANQLTVFDTAILAPFWSVHTLDLSRNRLTALNVSVPVDIRRLVLKENFLEEFPDLCLSPRPSLSPPPSSSDPTRSAERAFYNLLSVYLSENPIRRIPPGALPGHCLPHLIKLDISGLTLLTSLEDHFVADLPRLQHLMVNKMAALSRYQPLAFNSSSLRVLSLNQNRRWDKEVVSPPHVFRYCPNLERLEIVDTKLDLKMHELRTLLSPLRSVRELNLQRIRTGSLPDDLLWRLSKLQKLRFTGTNMNSAVLGRALVNVTGLTYLNVQANALTVVNDSVLPWPFRRDLQWLDISLNPFTCTCQLLWFSSWLGAVMDNGSVHVNNYSPGSWQYRCSTPPAMKNVRLANFKPTLESCATRNPYVLLGVVAGCVLAALLLVLLAVYRYRWHLRFYLYRLRRQYVQVPGGLGGEGEGAVEVFRYDAYLAHSSQDLDWIHDELLPLLEGQHGLRLFVEERDSVPGTVIMDNITRYMDESARVMLLISDSYNREGLRQCEFEHILYAVIEQQKDVIVVLLGDVEAGRMTRDMRRMLTRGTFLQWGDSPEAQRAFREGLRVALRTQDNHMHSLC